MRESGTRVQKLFSKFYAGNADAQMLVRRMRRTAAHQLLSAGLTVLVTL